MHTSILLKRLRDKFVDFTNEEKLELLNIVSRCTTDSNSIIVPEKDNGFYLVDANEIYYAHEQKKGKVIIKTRKGKSEYTNNACDILEYLDNNNKSFRYLNKDLVVNIDKILSYNSYYRKIFFADDKELVITGAAMDNIIVKILGKEKDLHKETFDSRYGCNFL